MRGIGYGFLIFLLVASGLFLVNCGSSGGGGGAGTGTVTTTITDPPTCQAPNGPFNEVWVTITRVRAHTSSDANSNDGGWVDLVDLRDNPRQIDLLSLDSTTCLLTQLGSTSGIPAGKYQQIRIYLLSNSPSSEAIPLDNQCGDDYNCVVLEDNSVQTLLLSSEANTGIKIPPGQIAGGGLTVLAGQTVDLNIDFDACASIVQQNNGQFRLKPTLRAGEISINTNSISGRVIDLNTRLPIPNAIVILETRDSAGIDRVVSQKLTGSDGGFIFCPLPQEISLYDVIAAARNTTTYNATVTFQVPVGQDMGDIPLVPDLAGPATISGQVTTSTGSEATSADIQLSALRPVSVAGISPVTMTIPLFADPTPKVIPTQSVACPLGTDCASYILTLPASISRARLFTTPSYTTPTLGNAVLEAQAFVPESGGLTDCIPSNMTENISLVAGTNFPVPLIFFTGCQVGF